MIKRIINKIKRGFSKPRKSVDKRISITSGYFIPPEVRRSNNGLINFPSELLTPYRFDVMAKYIYGKYRSKGSSSKWHVDLYSEHLKVWNNYVEQGRHTKQEKDSEDKFISCFNDLLDSIKTDGFNEEISRIWINNNGHIINGGHRLAGCLLYDKKPACEVHDSAKGQANCSSYYFLNKKDNVAKGLSVDYADSMALQYARLKPNTYIVTLFPSAVGKDEIVRQALLEYGMIVYEKAVDFHNNGPFNFVRTMYQGEKWVGTWDDEFKGTNGKVEPCFCNPGPVKIFLFECKSHELLGEYKDKIRDIYKIGKHSVHINDSHEETLRLAEIVFNKNTIHFTNNSRLKYFDIFTKYFAQFINWIKQSGVCSDDICVDGSAVLSAYGVRDCRDIDFLYHDDYIDTESKTFSCHNEEGRYYPVTKDEIIYNPSNHFYYRGIKFASLEMVKQMKSKRSEEKDKKDLLLIKKVI